MIFRWNHRINLWHRRLQETRVDLRQLRYFVKVVEYGNVTRASEILRIAQPAISQQMRNLENDMGMQLLERSVHGVVATAAGRTLYRHALDLLRQADNTRDLLRQDAEFPQGKVSVAMPSSTARVLAIPLARLVRDRYPGIVLELIEAPTVDIPVLIGGGRVELAIVTAPSESRGIATHKLLTEALYLVASPELVIPCEPLPLAELALMPLILPCPPNTIRSRIDLALRDARLPCEIILEANSTALLLAAVIAKFGVTILPWSAAHVELAENKLKLVHVDHRLFSRDISLCWHSTGSLSNAVQKVKASILELFAHLGQRPEWAVAP
jgi:LysR family nitrogen assimilation transcriptional regulator